MWPAQCGIECAKKEASHFAEQLSESRVKNAASCHCICPRAGKTLPQIKFRAAFRAATACESTKIVDSQQHERLKTDEYHL
jgi:hypothetical protein